MNAASGPARRRGGWRRPVLGAVGAALIVAGLVLAGVVPGVGLEARAPPAPRLGTEQAAVALAEPLVAETSGGPWVFFEAAGNSTVVGGPLGENATAAWWATFATCPLPDGDLPEVTLPASAGANYSQGVVGTWALGYFSPAGAGAVLVVLVEGGAARVFGEVAGDAACPLNPPPATALAPAVDSSAAAAAVNANPNGSAFVRAHPSANATYRLLPGYSTGTGWAPLWIVEYVACGPDAPGGASALEAFVSGIGGKLTAVVAGPAVCSTGIAG